MAKSKSSDTPVDFTENAPSSKTMTTLVALGALSALWALFLWAELVVARSGGTAFCAVNETVDCATLWDGNFATMVHKYTRLPVAGWGLVWSLLATGFPLLALFKRSERQDTTTMVSATRLVAGVGLVTTILLILIAASAGILCIGCIGTYVIVALYAFVGLYSWRSYGFKNANQAVGPLVIATIAGFALLLWPGIKTPSNAAAAGKDAIASAASGTKPVAQPHTPPPAQPTAPTKTAPPEFATGPGTGDPQKDAQIEQFLLSLPPQLQQQVSDSLYAYNHAEAIKTDTPRAIHGSKDAKIKIVDWTDPMCGHCAQLHDTLGQIEKAVPAGTFSVESRYFPLDQTCNPGIQRKGDGLRCTIVGAQICMENKEGADAFTSYVFSNQRNLTEELVFEAAKRFTDVNALKTCINSPETKAKLASDLAYAERLRPDGTPIVLLNGRKSSSVGPYLFVMMLTEGKAQHPAFAILPPPNKNAHLH